MGCFALWLPLSINLWESNDRSGLILPGSIPLDAPRVREELLRYLPEGWNAVVDNDVDGAGAAPRAMTRKFAFWRDLRSSTGGTGNLHGECTSCSAANGAGY